MRKTGQKPPYIRIISGHRTGKAGRDRFGAFFIFAVTQCGIPVD